MIENVLTKTRRRVGIAMTVLAALCVISAFTPGLPVLWEPRASARERAQGQTLFVHEWRPHDSLAHGDGLGPVFNARSCEACHFQGGVGGGGGNDHNVMSFEAHPTKDRPELQGGLIHKYAVANRFLENQTSLRSFFPIVAHRRSDRGRLPDPDAQLRPGAYRVRQRDSPLRRGVDRSNVW